MSEDNAPYEDPAPHQVVKNVVNGAKRGELSVVVCKLERRDWGFTLCSSAWCLVPVEGNRSSHCVRSCGKQWSLFAAAYALSPFGSLYNEIRQLRFFVESDYNILLSFNPRSKFSMTIVADTNVVTSSMMDSIAGNKDSGQRLSASSDMRRTENQQRLPEMYEIVGVLHLHDFVGLQHIVSRRLKQWRW